MPKTFTYSFSTPADSNLTIVTGDTTQTTGNTATYTGFPIESISGTFNGEAITGLYGASGQYQLDSGNNDNQDNLIVQSEPASGQQPSTDGIDQYGISFTTQSGHLYTIENNLGGGFFYRQYNSPTSSSNSTGTAILASTNYATAVCFCGGTLIRVMRDGQEMDVAVDHLRAGDLALATTGKHRPIRWVGHRSIECRRHPRPHEVMPVRVAAHAFGADRPARDLLVSPGHSLCVDVLGEVLIPAAALVNGSTITQEEVESVTYWHVELDGHDILLAENMPAESYLEMGNRGFFAGGGVVELDASPDAPVPTHADFCRPFHSQGALVDAVRGQLAARALQLGWILQEQGLGDLHLIVDGVRLEPRVRGLTARFAVPADAADAWLVSRTGVPAHIHASPDGRALGLRVGGLVVDDGFGAPRAIAADDPRLCVGFHGVERDGNAAWRWTAGLALLPASLWDGTEGAFFLRVDLASAALPRWVAPAPAAANARPRLAG